MLKILDVNVLETVVPFDSYWLENYGELVGNDKFSFWSSYNVPTHFRNLQRSLKYVWNVTLFKYVSYCSARSGLPYYDMTVSQSNGHPISAILKRTGQLCWSRNVNHDLYRIICQTICQKEWTFGLKIRKQIKKYFTFLSWFTGSLIPMSNSFLQPNGLILCKIIQIFCKQTTLVMYSLLTAKHGVKHDQTKIHHVDLCYNIIAKVHIFDFEYHSCT